MSLDNIQLPPKVVAELYKESLVVLKDLQATTERAAVTENIAGQAPAQILLITPSSPDTSEKTFLDKLLAACKLNPEEAKNVNILEHAPDYNYVIDLSTPPVVLLFGVGPAQIGLPLEFPNYQVQKHHGKTFLACDPLNLLTGDPAAKKILWECLKKIYGL